MTCLKQIQWIKSNLITPTTPMVACRVWTWLWFFSLLGISVPTRVNSHAENAAEISSASNFCFLLDSPVPSTVYVPIPKVDVRKPELGSQDSSVSGREPSDYEIMRHAFDLLRNDPARAAQVAVGRLERPKPIEPEVHAKLAWVAGSGFSISNQPQLAFEQLLVAETISRNLRDERLLRRTLRYLSSTAFELQKYDLGSKAAQEALEISERMNDDSDYVALLHNELALNESKLANFESTVEHFEKGLKITEKSGNLKLQIMIMTNLGTFYSAIGRIESAAAIHQKTSELASKNDIELVECVALLNYAECLQRLQRVDESRNALELAQILLGKPSLEHLRPQYESALSFQVELENAIAQANRTDFEIARNKTDSPLPPSEDAAEPIKNRMSDAEFERTIDRWVEQLEIAKQKSDYAGAVGICRSMADLCKQHEQWPLATKFLEELDNIKSRLWQSADGINALAIEEHLAKMEISQTRVENQNRAELQTWRMNYYRAMAWMAFVAFGFSAICASLLWVSLRTKRRMVVQLQRASEEIRDQKESQILIERRLLERQKSESLSMMAAGIAHDFNNLLTGIVGLAESGRLENGEGPKDRFFRQIVHASMRASDLTMQLRQYLGDRNHADAVIDLTSNIESMWGLLVSLVRNRAIIDFHGGDQLLLARIDEVGFQQIVINLVANAAEASTVSSTIEVIVGKQSLTSRQIEGFVHQKSLQPGDYCFVQVLDHGTGMEESTIDRMFDPYFSTKGEGRGLGMASLLGIVRSCHGGIHVVSSRNSGTSITVYIPLAKSHLVRDKLPVCDLGNGQSPLLASRHNIDLEHDLQKGCILLVDDEVVVRESVEMLLKFSGYQVIATDGVANAMMIIEERGGEIGCIVSDYSMPDQSGIELAQLARKLLPDVPFILCSGYSDQDLNQPPEGLKLLHKPFLPEQLLLTIETSMEQRGNMFTTRANEELN